MSVVMLKDKIRKDKNLTKAEKYKEIQKRQKFHVH